MRNGYTQGDTATISETVQLIDPTMCTNTAVVTNVNGATTNSPLGAGLDLLLSSAFGYEGTLICTLFGVLFTAGSGLGPTAAPTITLAAAVNPGSAARVVKNVGVVDYYTFGDPADTGRDSDDATVTLGGLPPTGGGPVTPLLTFGILALLAGASAVVLARLRRGKVAARC